MIYPPLSRIEKIVASLGILLGLFAGYICGCLLFGLPL